MPEINSKRFVQLFQSTLAKGGTIAESDMRALESASRQIGDGKEKAAAEGLLKLVRNDKELDSFEVTPARKALGVLLGVSKGPLPADLEKALAHAVPQANVNVKHYDLTFDFSKDGSSFPARAVIQLEKKAPKQTVLEANASRLDVTQVLADGKPAKFEIKDNRLVVSAPGAKTIDVSYNVKPTNPGDTSYGLIRDKYSGRMWTMTWPYNTGALFPSNSAPKDGVTSSVTVKVADGKTVVAGGEQKDGTFDIKYDAPAYGIAFYLGDKMEAVDAGKSKDGVQVTGFGMANAGIQRGVRQAYLETAKKSLDFYSSWLGGYEYGKELKLVEITGGLGGMEHTGAVAIMDTSARDPSYALETAAHETAHHWFGDNLRIASWGDFWMSEGFTTYATTRYFRSAEGESKFFSLLDRMKGEVQDSLEANPHALTAPANTDVNEIFDSVSYEMGGWMLRMMEAQVGTKKFDALLKDWYGDHKGKTVSTTEFVAFAKQKTGHDFAPFFKAWGDITAVPKLKAAVTSSGNKVEVKLDAKTPLPKGIQIPLRIEGEGGKTTTVMVDPTKPQSIDAGFKVKGWTWDPERTVMAFVS